MNDITERDIPPAKTLPFDNLYLNAGYVTGFNQWWMYALTILFTVLCYISGQLIAAFLLLMKAEQNGVSFNKLSDPNKLFDYKVIGVDKNIVLLALLGIFVITFIGFLLALKRLHVKTLTSILTGYATFRYKRFWFAFSIWGGILLITLILNYIFDPQSLAFNFNWQGFLISMGMMFFLMPIQTGFEEVFFRGYLIQGLSQVFKNGIVPLIITSLLFGSAHMSNPEARELGRPVMLAYYTSFALFLGCLTLLDEGLELAFGIHFANNFISSLLINSPNGVLKTYSLFDTTTENAYAEIALWFGTAAVTFIIFWLKYRWKNFKLIIR